MLDTLSLSWSDEACLELERIMDQNPFIRTIEIWNESGKLVHQFRLEEKPKDTDANQTPKPEGNAVAHPSHYNQGKYEVKDVIRDWNLNFNLGNAVKYIARAPYKHPDRIIEDYEKAKQYIDFEIEYLKGN